MRSTHGGNDAQVDEGLSLLASTSEQGGQRLSLSRRSVILREAGLARLKSRAPLTLQVARPTGIWLWLEAPSRIPAFATLMAAVLIVGFAYMRTSLPVQDLPTREPLPTGPSDVRVSQNGDEIVLQWSDAKKD